MRITGTFLDEISCDIPHQNWGREEWDRDFAAMKAIGIHRVIMIRCCLNNFMTYDSKVIPHYSPVPMHRPPVDLVDMFLDLSEKYGMEFYFGTGWNILQNEEAWFGANARKEAEINCEIISEAQERYGNRKAFAGWYLTQEVSGGDDNLIDLFRLQGAHAKQVSGGKSTMISPYFAGVKAGSGEGFRPLTVEEHSANWEKIFRNLQGALDIVAFQDGHVNFDELPAYLTATRKLADKYNIACWTNAETFDRDMPIHFLPIKWEKLLWKMESAEAAGIRDAITFEFSHFLSPHSMYQSAHGLFDRYCEYCGLDVRAKDF